MKYSAIWISYTISLATATYIRSFGDDTKILLQARAAPRLLARMNDPRRSNNRSPQRQSSPYATLVAEGPATGFKNGPDSNKFSIPGGAHVHLLSHGTKKPYIDGRLLGEASSHAGYQSLSLHPLKVMASGKTATAQVSVPPKGLGVLKTTSPGHHQTYFVPGGSEKKVHVEADNPGEAEAFASVSRPGKASAEAQR